VNTIHRRSRTERAIFVQVLHREYLRWIRRLKYFADVGLEAQSRDGSLARDCVREFLDTALLLQGIVAGDTDPIATRPFVPPDEALRACESMRLRTGEVVAALSESRWREQIPVPVGLVPGYSEPRRRGELAWLVLKGLMLQGKRFDERSEGARPELGCSC
jgi:hypothetical protein